jgi:large subunit ribosomal protein L15
MKLHDLQPTPGSRRAARRVGRGHGSGRGKTAGRGTKGQKARSGGTIPAWFEGGQTPLHVRTPKLRGFKNRFRVAYAPVNLARLSEAASGTLITPEVLVHDGVVSDTRRPVKLLGVGDAPKGVTIHAHAFSRSAVEKLEAAGSTIQRLSWPDNLPITDEPAEAEPAKDEAKARRRERKAAAAAAADEADEADDVADEADDAADEADAAPAGEAADQAPSEADDEEARTESEPTA